MPGGLAKALRTVPVVLDIAERVRRATPDAWIIDFTNPVGIVTRALLQAGHRAVGLCNVAIGFQRKFAGLLGVAPEQVRLDHVGLNHLTWERGVRLLDADGRRRPAARAARGARRRRSPRTSTCPWRCCDRLGVVPSYYLRYFYAHDEVVARAADVARPGPPRWRRSRRSCWTMYADPTLDEKPELLLQSEAGPSTPRRPWRWSPPCCSDRGDVQVVNIRNDGTLPFLPGRRRHRGAGDGRRARAPARCRRAAGAAVRRAGRATSPRTSSWRWTRRCTAAGERVFEALLAHPLVGQIDLRRRA